MLQLFNWFYDFILSIDYLWNWFITPIDILGANIAPIYLIGGGMLVLGILRAVL